MSETSINDLLRKKKKKKDNDITIDSLLDKKKMETRKQTVTPKDKTSKDIIDLKTPQELSEKENNRDDGKGKIFKAGAFDDGFDWSDLIIAPSATATDFVGNVVRGGSQFIEGITDGILLGASGVSSLVGAKKTAKDIKKFAEKDHTQEWYEDVEDDFVYDSLLGEDARGVPQGLGQIGALTGIGKVGQAIGVVGRGLSALSSASMFTSSAGSGMIEAYQNGATDEEAIKYGVMQGGIDAGTELMFGGLGKGLNALGLSHGLLGVDDMVAKGLTKGIKNQTVKNITQGLIKSVGEGIEEPIAGYLSAHAQKGTFRSEDDFDDIVKDQQLGKQFLTGMLVSDIAQTGSVVQSSKQGTDLITGYTQNEQKVIDEIAKKEIESIEKENGKPLTTKEKNKIKANVDTLLQRGEIDIDTIESTLGGETYKAYDSLVKESDEYDKLANIPGEKLSLVEQKRRDSLDAKNTEKSYTERKLEAKMKLSEEVRLATQNDMFLQESYAERGRRGEQFTVSEEQMKKYSEKEREIVQKAIDYGEMNNTRKAHEFVDLVAKLSADKGVSFDFTNNEKLKNSGFALEGKTINGFKSGNNIVVNLQSKNALNTVVGHEITHVLEGSKELYKALQDTVIEYAKQKGVYDSMYKDTVHLYRNQFQNETLQKRKELYDSEITADLVGQYIFSDVNFVRNLSMKNRNVFQKVYDEIKYMLKSVTSGSDAERQLLKAKKIFEDVYRDTKKNTSEKTQLSMTSDNYKKAVEKGDLNKAQKIVEKRAKANGYDVFGYHGTNEGGFTQFDAKYSDDGISLFIAKNKKTAQSYTEHYTENEIDLNSNEKQEGLYRVAVKMENPYVIDGKGRNWDSLSQEKAVKNYDIKVDITKNGNSYGYVLKFTDGKNTVNTTFASLNELQNALPKNMSESVKTKLMNTLRSKNRQSMAMLDVKTYTSDSTKAEMEMLHTNFGVNKKGEIIGKQKTRDWSRYAKEHGYDGVIIKNVQDSGGYSQDAKAEMGDIYIAFDSEQIKSLNAVTYDNKGNVIPLEKRFDDSKKDIRFSFSGENALNKNNELLIRAKSMQEEGVTSETIRKETGWHQGYDGKWRFEIDDSQMKVYKGGDALFRKNHPEYARLQDLYDKFWESDLTNAETKELEALDEIYGNEYGRLHERVRNGNAKLKDILEHDVLYANYPMLADMKVVLEKFKDGTRGSFSRGEGRITLDKDLFESDFRTSSRDKTLIHEIQHAIQYLEDFANGSSPDFYESQKQELTDWIRGTRENLDLYLKDINYDEYKNKMFEEITDKAVAEGKKWREVAQDYYDALDEYKASSKYAKEISNLEAQLEDLGKQYDERFGKVSDDVTPYSLYRNTAGEIEARDTANRLRKTDEERRDIAPLSKLENVKKDGVVFTDDYRYSLSNNIDTEYMQAVEKGDIYSAQKMVDKVARENGYAKRMFHETDAENIHIFDISRGTHGGNDSQTPYGIFTKSSDKNIGLGKKQMALYVKADKTLFVENRDEVSKKIPQLIPYYDQIAEIDRKYDALAEEMEDVELGALEEWMEANPDVDMDVVYPNSYIIEGKPADIDDAKYQKAFKERQEIMAKWRSETDAISIKCKDIITKHLRDNGYDSMYFKVDGGSFGRQTDSLIVLDTNQVKSANFETYDDNGNVIPLSQRFNADNNDIRFSLTDNKGRELTEAQQERFKDSKVRDEDGNLLVVYHGTNEDFNIFDFDKIGKNGTAEGHGFYFSDDQEITSMYGDKQKEVYLNIKKPLYSKRKTIKKSELVNFINAMVDNYIEQDADMTWQDSFLSDYTDTYSTSRQNAVREVANIIYEGNDNDTDVVYEIANATGSVWKNSTMKEFNNVLTSSTGYDGIIAEWKNENGSSNVYVTFESNQAKNVDNMNPTDNADIRHSLGEKPLAPKPNGIYAEDVALEKPIAPIKEDLVQDSTSVVQDDVYAPLTEEEANERDSQMDRINSLQEAEEPQEVEPPFYSSDTGKLSDADLREVRKGIKDHLPLQRGRTQEFNEIVQRYATSDFPNRRELYNEIKQKFGKITVEQEITDVAEAQKMLRQTRINVSDNIKNGTSDYLYTMRSNFGKIRFSKDGMPVDVAYQELSNLYPHLFPDDIVNEIDQFEQIVDVANMMRTENGEFEVDEDALDNTVNSIVTSIRDINQRHNQNVAERRNRWFDKERLIEQYMETDDYSDLQGNPNLVKVFHERWDRNRITTEPQIDTTVAENLTHGEKTMGEKWQEKKEGIARKWAIFKSSILDKGAVFEDLSKVTKNRRIEELWDYQLSSTGQATHLIMNGDNNVNSLIELEEKVMNTGLSEEFEKYLYHYLNIDRMTLDSRFGIENKTVYGSTVTSEISQEIVKEMEQAHPEFKEFAKEVYAWNNNLRSKLVNAGIITQETADLWQDMYPHYVPIKRVDSVGKNINVPLATNRTGVNAPIKRAVGGNSDIMPLFDTMKERTTQTFTAINKNMFGVELKNTLGSTLTENTQSIDEAIEMIETQDALLEAGKNGYNPTFTVFEDGKRVTFEITQEMYEALSPMSKRVQDFGIVPLQKASAWHRAVLTEYNPAFLLNNFIKDTQDVFLNSQHALKTYLSIPEAIKQLTTNGEFYQEYMRHGGGDTSYFDVETSAIAPTTKNKVKKGLMLPFQKISDLNNFVEKVPRMAEYIASRKLGKDEIASMLDASRVTTNFKAGGDVTKFLNKNGFTFLNASVQGANQQARNWREANQNGLKGYVKLATKYALAGLTPYLLNRLLWDDDEEYEELSDYVKQNYYVMWKTEDGKFFRVPKGRAVAVIQDAVEQMDNVLTGDDEANFNSFFKLVISNLAPNNPITNNVVAPIVQVTKNESWYGGDIVPESMQDLPSAEQFDESTDSLSKAIGSALDVSPMKVNYLLNQYSGVIGDVALPYMTQEVTSGDDGAKLLLAPIKDKFITDGKTNKQSITDFYEMSDKLTTNAVRSQATTEDVLKNKYFNSVKGEMNELYKQKREVQNSNLSRKEKYEKVREIQEQISELAKQGLQNYEDVEVYDYYGRVDNKHYHVNSEGEWQKVTDKQLAKQDSVTSSLGINANEYWGNKEEYDYAYEYPGKYGIAKAVGGYASYTQYQKALNNLEADKNASGKSIPNSLKNKKFAYINNLNVDYNTKMLLWKQQYPSDDRYNVEIIEYLNSRSDISYQEMVEILEELDFTVSADGTVRWN